MTEARFKPTRDWLETVAELDAQGIKIIGPYSGDPMTSPVCDFRYDPIERVVCITQRPNRS